MATYNERNAELRLAEIDLQEKTLALLVELLSLLTFEQLENISGLELDDFNNSVILTITPTHVMFESYDGFQPVEVELMELAQPELKTIIDHILINKINE